METKRGQISSEYLILLSFITFIVLLILGISFFYSSQLRDTIKFRELETFSKKLISSAESVYYSGEPSRTTFTAYIPEGIQSITIDDHQVLFTIATSSGFNIISYTSNVPLEGSIPATSGVKKVVLVAQEDKVVISA